jgi:hypothetical protein
VSPEVAMRLVSVRAEMKSTASSCWVWRKTSLGSDNQIRASLSVSITSSSEAITRSHRLFRSDHSGNVPNRPACSTHRVSVAIISPANLLTTFRDRLVLFPALHPRIRFPEQRGFGFQKAAGNAKESVCAESTAGSVAVSARLLSLELHVS